MLEAVEETDHIWYVKAVDDDVVVALLLLSGF